MFLEEIPHGGFQAAETEIKISFFRHRAGKGIERGITLLGQKVHLHASGIAETEKLRSLVKGFPRGVIQRAAHHPVTPGAQHFGQLGMATADEQGDMRRYHLLTEKRREQVSLKMI